jgi:hypothetical protein
MQEHPDFSFVWVSNNTMDMPVIITLKEQTNLSLDGVNSKQYKKGEELTSQSTLQRRLFEHLVETGKAELSIDAKETKSEGKKVKKPKETKSKKKSSSKKDS